MGIGRSFQEALHKALRSRPPIVGQIRPMMIVYGQRRLTVATLGQKLRSQQIYGLMLLTQPTHGQKLHRRLRWLTQRQQRMA